MRQSSSADVIARLRTRNAFVQWTTSLLASYNHRIAKVLLLVSAHTEVDRGCRHITQKGVGSDESASFSLALVGRSFAVQ